MRIVRFSVDVSGIRQLRQRHRFPSPSPPAVTIPPQAPVVDSGAIDNGPTVRTTPPPGTDWQP